MPNTILKRWNGSSFEELYPKTTVGQISASGTPSSTTFLRGDGQWATPADTTTLTSLGLTATATELNYVDGVTSAIQTQLNGKAASSHTHGNITNAGAIGSTSGLAIFTTTSGVLTTRSVTDLNALTQLGSGSTNAVTERTVYYGTHQREIGVSSAIASSTSFTTLSFTSGMRDFWLYIHQDTTTGAVIARLPLTITSAQSIGTASPGKTHRVAWSNGSVTQVMNVDVYYSGTTLYFRHNFTGASLAFRWFGY